ncbi:MAG: SRPBCC family protein [Polyangia bacterium]
MRLEVTTVIDAPPERCFDLARSIDFHVVTAEASEERAIAGKTSGLLELDETVTWRAKHLGVRQELTSKMTVVDRPHHFQDVMVRGAFASMVHDHHFELRDGVTHMRDVFVFTSPLGPLGALVDAIYLGRYMRRFLVTRARILKETAESDAWRAFVPDQPQSR